MVVGGFKDKEWLSKRWLRHIKRALKKIEEEQAHCEEQGELFLVGQYNIYIKLLRMFIKDLEKLD